MHLERKNNYIYFFVAMCALLLLAHNLKSFLYGCLHTMDLGVYSEAIFRIAKHGDLNPYLLVRDVKLFNDHVDPIVFLAVPFAWIFNYHIGGLLFFEWLWLCAFLYLIWKTSLPGKWQIIFLLCAIFCRGILTSFTFPIHPSTWSIIPAFLLSYHVIREDHNKILLYSFVLCLFKESMPFVILAMGFSYLIQKKFRTGWLILFIAVFFLVLDFIILPFITGPRYGHGMGFMHHLATEPLAFLISVCTQFGWTGFLKLFLPFFLPIAYLLKNNRTLLAINNPLFNIFCAYSPLFFLHLLANRFEFQYSAVFMGAFFPILTTYLPAHLPTKRHEIIFLLLFVLPSMSIYTKMVKSVFFNKHPKCEISSDKKAAINEIKQIIAALPHSSIILASGGILPIILDVDHQIYQLALYSKRMERYDYLLLERHGTGDTFPLNPSNIENMAKRCLTHLSSKVIENRYFYLWMGAFSDQCLEQNRFWTPD